MKTIVILIANYKKEVDIDQILSDIRKYIGTRMIENKSLDEGAPIIPLNNTLADGDKKTISELCGNNVAPAFIEYHEDEKELMDTYLTARVRR